MNIQIDQLGIYNDGFIVSAKCNSSILDLFIDDINQFLSDDFGILRADQPPAKRIYDSQIVVEMSGDVQKKMDLLKGLFQDMADLSERYNGERGDYYLAGFHLESGNDGPIAKRPPTFMMARRTGVDVKAGYWWSQAELKTEDHLKILERIDVRL